MNKRIQEIAEQSGMIQTLNEHASEYGSGMFENTQYPELEKFAELIVKECIDKAERYGLGCDAVEQLKEHFGVEE